MIDYEIFLSKPLADYRGRANLKTKTELAKLLGINIDTYRKVEKGWRPGGLRSVIRNMFDYFQGKGYDKIMVETLLKYCGVNLKKLKMMFALDKWHYKPELPKNGSTVFVIEKGYNFGPQLCDFYDNYKGITWYASTGWEIGNDKIYAWLYVDDLIHPTFKEIQDVSK